MSTRMKYKIGTRLSHQDWCMEEYEIKAYAITDEKDKKLKYLVERDYGGYNIITEEELEKTFFVVRGGKNE